MKDFISVYLFYIVDTSFSHHKYPAVDINDVKWNGKYGNTLYAFTPKKDLAKMFKDMRDPKKFICQKVKMNASQYENFNRKYFRRMLSDFPYKTNFINKEGYFVEKSRNILSTEREHDEVQENGIDYIMDVIDFMPPDSIRFIKYLIENDEVFHKKYINALGYILAVEDFVRDTYYPADIESSPNIDQVSLYLKLFSNTFKEGSNIKCESLSSIENLIKKTKG